MSALHPASEAELAEMVRAAAARRERLVVQGGGTRGLGHAVEGTALVTAGLSGISLYEPGALTLVVQAGTPLAEVEAALAAEGQQLPFEPWDGRALSAMNLGANGVPTVGGMVAVNASGPRRLQAGACRDSMIGVRFVDGTGAVVKNGGRVMKNVTGLDLVKLMAGSHGTLGVLTEVAFKVLPKPETVTSLVFEGLSDEQAVAVMTAATGTPYEVSGAAHLPAEGRTMLRLEGFAGSVAHRAKALSRALGRFGTAQVVEGPGDWAAVRDAAAFGGRTGAVWRISVKPTDGAKVAAALPRAGLVLDWAGGLVWALVDEDHDLRVALTGIPGHATLVRASEPAKARWGAFPPEPARVAAIARGLRAKFDPAGILNPGRMGADAPVAA